MADLEPDDVKNLDRGGNPALAWSRARELLERELPRPDIAVFLGTVDPDGRPHSTGVAPLWHDGDLYFSTGSGTRKARNLRANPACTLSFRLTGLDLVLTGDTVIVDDPGTLEQVAAGYRDGGWPAQVEDGGLTAPFGAPSAGPPPWFLYRMAFTRAVGLGTAEPNGATRWRFTR